MGHGALSRPRPSPQEHLQVQLIQAGRPQGNLKRSPRKSPQSECFRTRVIQGGYVISVFFSLKHGLKYCALKPNHTCSNRALSIASDSDYILFASCGPERESFQILIVHDGST